MEFIKKLFEELKEFFEGDSVLASPEDIDKLDESDVAPVDAPSDEATKE